MIHELPMKSSEIRTSVVKTYSNRVQSQGFTARLPNDGIRLPIHVAALTSVPSIATYQGVIDLGMQVTTVTGGFGGA